MTNLQNQFTELEIKLMEAIKETWGQGGYCTYLADAASFASMNTKIARGVISSLIKKGIVLECLPQYGNEINLTDKGIEFLNIPSLYD
jgi:predicted transcriptional regulator